MPEMRVSECERERAHACVWDTLKSYFKYEMSLLLSCVFCLSFLKWSRIALQYCFSFYSATWISSRYVDPLLFPVFLFLLSLLVGNTLLFPLPTLPLNSTSSRKPSWTPFIILSSLPCAFLFWWAYHTMLHVVHSSACLSWLWRFLRARSLPY